MKKSTKMVKKLLALFLVVLMSINSLGAVVSDNDGSAFITKAEFDSLKNDFQSQIDQYNTSIDAKIDGAIAAYLSGIKIERRIGTKIVDWWDQVCFMDDIMIYSKQAVYTGPSTWSPTALKYHRPNTANRDTVESSTLAIWSFTSGSYGTGGIVRVQMKLNNQAGSGVQNARTAGDFQSVDRNSLPPTVLYMWKDAGGYWAFNSGLRTAAGGNTWVLPPHYLASINDGSTDRGGAETWAVGYEGTEIINDTSTNGLIFSNINSHGVGRWTFKFKAKSSMTGGVFKNFTFVDDPWREDMMFGYNWYELPTEVKQTNINTTVLNTTELRTMDYYDSTAARDNDEQIFKNLLLGRDQDYKINVAHRLPYNRLGMNSRDLSESESINVGFTTTSQSFGWYNGVYNSGNWQIGMTGKTGAISWPLWDRVKVNELRNGNFYYNGKPLMIGEGLPLGEPLTANGAAIIKMKWAKEDVQGLDVDTSKKVAVKIKRGNFLDASSVYCSGRVNDSLNTTLFDGSSVFDSDIEYSFYIDDLKIDDQLWLQLSPAGNSTDIYTGDYVKLSKLSVEYETS